jgi:Asp-tRNA(Asn)/Glu-tRNA(Gln) amidotransferase A subunit family amidase
VDPTDYQRLDAVALAELVAAGQATPRDLLHAARQRAAAVNPKVNAVVRWMAPEADTRVGEPLTGPFAGVPFLLKDLGQHYAGIPTSGGSRSRADVVATEHATVVQRWLDAGLVIFGKTNTPEFGARGVTEPVLFGPTRNPWNLAHTSGGSSGGAAAAVAAGIVPVAAASDGGGSIRIPAACCGLFGLKVGRGVLPAGPETGESFHGAAVDGVISRSVRDTAAMIDVLAGPAPADPYRRAAFATPLRDEVGRDPGSLRIGVQVASALMPEPHPAAVAAIEDAKRTLRDLGHTVERAPVGYDDAALAEDFLLPWFVHIAAEVAASRRHGDGRGRKDSEEFEFDTRIMAALGAGTGALAHTQSLDRWQGYVRQLADYHARYDLLLTPTLATPPVRIGQLATPWYERLGGTALLAVHGTGILARLGMVKKAVRKNLSWVCFTQLANLTGRPAMTVPLYWTPEGLPLGVQFVAPPGGEPLLVRLASQLEQARPWSARRPQL